MELVVEGGCETSATYQSSFCGWAVGVRLGPGGEKGKLGQLGRSETGTVLSKGRINEIEADQTVKVMITRMIESNLCLRTSIHVVDTISS